MRVICPQAKAPGMSYTTNQLWTVDRGPQSQTARHDYLVSEFRPVLTIKIMGSVNIDAEDSISVKEFEDGNSIQVRVLISNEEKSEYEKGKKVKVIHDGGEMTGKIVSDPILIDRKRDDGKITLSLIVEKS